MSLNQERQTKIGCRKWRWSTQKYLMSCTQAYIMQHDDKAKQKPAPPLRVSFCWRSVMNRLEECLTVWGWVAAARGGRGSDRDKHQIFEGALREE